MKANRAIASALSLALAACSTPTVVPPPAPRPAPRPAPPPPPPPPPSNWRDAPATPGDWSWSIEGGRSTARFSGGLAFACDRAGGRVLLYRQGTPVAAGNGALTIHTQTATRQVAGTAASLGDAPALVVAFAANDPLLDAMAFSRGRFAVQAAGLPALYVPSWPEISRVIEDCR